MIRFGVKGSFLLMLLLFIGMSTTVSVPEITAETTLAENGRWGVPDTTFTLPGPAGDGGMYYPDVQASFPAVDWANLDRLYIPAGHYKFIRLGNLPNRSMSDPLVITNYGGQVRIGGLGHYYVFPLGGGSGWVLTGRYDPVSQTGHPDFTGHADGAYANSQGTYGIYINDEHTDESAHDVSGLGVGGGATQFELEFVEIARTGFAGITVKTDDDGDALMSDVRIHDLYIHDTGGEGMYIGSTQSQPQHKFENLEIYNNRVLRTALETIQIGQLGDGVNVYNNVFGPGAIGWRSAFQQYQDKNLQIGYREGIVEIHHNVFIGAMDSLIYLNGVDIAGDVHSPGDGVQIHDNFIAHTGWLGGYFVSATPQASYSVENNYIRGYRFIRNEVYNVNEATHFFRLNQNNGAFPINFDNNRFELPNHLSLVSVLSNVDGNDVNGNVSGSGNERGVVKPIEFMNSGLASDFDYSRLELWTEKATVVGSEPPVSYKQNDIVMNEGIPYRCQVSVCASGLVPPDNPGTWSELPLFPDDVRLWSDSDYAGIGLVPTVERKTVFLPMLVK